MYTPGQIQWYTQVCEIHDKHKTTKLEIILKLLKKLKTGALEKLNCSPWKLFKNKESLFTSIKGNPKHDNDKQSPRQSRKSYTQLYLPKFLTNYRSVVINVFATLKMSKQMWTFDHIVDFEVVVIVISRCVLVDFRRAFPLRRATSAVSEARKTLKFIHTECIV